MTPRLYLDTAGINERTELKPGDRVTFDLSLGHISFTRQGLRIRVDTASGLADKFPCHIHERTQVSNVMQLITALSGLDYEVVDRRANDPPHLIHVDLRSPRA